MAKFNFELGDWVDEDIKRFASADSKANAVLKMALYEGAKIVADEVHKAASQHGSLADGLYVTKMTVDSDGVSNEIKFAGYDENGTPYPLIANVLESGRSSGDGVTAKHPFFRKAVSAAKPRAKEAMRNKFYESVTNILEGNK